MKFEALALSELTIILLLLGLFLLAKSVAVCLLVSSPQAIAFQ